MQDQDVEAQLDEIAPLVETMFELSMTFVEKVGNFLPHGASMNGMGQVALCGVAAEEDLTSAVEVLPMMHEALRACTAEYATRAIAVSESVFVGPNQTPAIKVLVEHREGLTMAFYMPWKKKLLRKPAFGDIQMQAAAPEIGEWKQAFVI